jgi:TATA-box binding protein (TBP) (component of TFIID and TFIIIB)
MYLLNKDNFNISFEPNFFPGLIVADLVIIGLLLTDFKSVS